MFHGAALVVHGAFQLLAIPGTKFALQTNATIADKALVISAFICLHLRFTNTALLSADKRGADFKNPLRNSSDSAMKVTVQRSKSLFPRTNCMLRTSLYSCVQFFPATKLVRSGFGVSALFLAAFLGLVAPA